MVIASWPAPVPAPRSEFGYLELSAEALRTAGIDSVPLTFTAEWIRQSRGTVDAIHLHWPEYRWSRSDAFLPTRVRQILGLRRFLADARDAGLARILTIHNLTPHESPDWIDRQGMRLAARYSDLLVAHSDAAASQAIAALAPRAPVVMMYHGAYDDVFPRPRDREVVRRELGVSDHQPLIACLGTIGPYKGHDVVCDAAVRLSDRARLLIAGRPRPGVDSRPLAAKVAGIEGGIFIERNLSPQEYADFAAASDVIVLAHHQSISSGALLAAWSLGRGAVTSDVPHFRELLALEPESGALFALGDPAALADAVVQYLRVPAERREQAALAQKRRFAWSRCIAPFVDAVAALRERTARLGRG